MNRTLALLGFLGFFGLFTSLAPLPASAFDLSSDSPFSFDSFYFAAGKELPECMGSDGRAIPVDNAQVIKWKSSTPNLFEARARVSGPIEEVYPERNGHEHFRIKIGPNASDTLEVVYNVSFGAMPELEVGMQTEACGDYITSNRDARYPASPDGAIIHWVHRATRGNHPSGYVTLNGNLFGYGGGGGKRRR